MPQCNATVLVSHAISDITSALIGVKTKENRTINAITKKEEKKEDGEEEERNILQLKSVRVTSRLNVMLSSFV